MILFTLQGNIGCGKSTFAQNFKNYLETRFNNAVLLVKEPVDEWTNIKGVNLLQLYYDDLKRWAFQFQTNALVDMVGCETVAKRVLLENKKSIAVMERNSFSVIELFSPLLLKMKILTETEKEILDKLNDALKTVNHTPPVCEIVIYIRTEPSVCLNRIEKRLRDEEVGKVSLSYLKDLHLMHETKLTSELIGVERKLWIVDGTAVDGKDISNTMVSTLQDENITIESLISTSLLSV